MTKFDVDHIAQCYDARYDELGYDVKTVGWGNVESQRLRFGVLSDIADLHGASICDVGCGFGDYHSYCQEKYSGVDYTGIDISGKLIGEAKNHYPSGKFERRDILTDPIEDQTFDYCLCSGALNLKIDRHENFVKEMIVAMFKMCKKGLAVNFLSKYVDYELEKDYHHSPEEIFTMAKSLTKYVTLRHDYPLWEFTVFMYKQDQFYRGKI